MVFCWFLIHIGIQGNHKADSIAKFAFNKVPDKNSRNLYTDVKPQIKQILTKKWQQQWEENSNNELYQIQTLIKERKPNSSKMRREEITLNRLRIGHCQLTHFYMLKQELPPKFSCKKPYTVKHILISKKLSGVARWWHSFCGYGWAPVRGFLCLFWRQTHRKGLRARFPTRPKEDGERQDPRAVTR